MILKDFIKAHMDEFKKAVEASVERDMECPYFRHDEDTEAERKYRMDRYRSFMDDILSSRPDTEHNDGIMFLLPSLDEDNPSEVVYNIYVYNTAELGRYEPQMQDVDFSAVDGDREKIHRAFEDYKEKPYITSYGYEFSPWEEWLALEVDTASFEKFGILNGFIDIINEMTFNGTNRESQEERRKELEESSRRADELMELSEEERQERLTRSEPETVFAGLNEGKTEEEIEAERREFLENAERAAVWFAIRKDRELARYKEKGQKNEVSY